MLYVVSYRDEIDSDSIIINTTSRSTNWSRGLSPFLLEGGNLYDNFYAYNVENAWQYSKVYPEHVDKDGNPTEKYFEWANKGWKTKQGIRYPMGKKTKPLYSYWDGKKYDYIEARKRIYVPLYSRSVLNSIAYSNLYELYLNNKYDIDICLLDFDGYNHIKMKMTLSDVLNNKDKKMGHAFVLYSLLVKDIKPKSKLKII